MQHVCQLIVEEVYSLKMPRSKRKRRQPVTKLLPSPSRTVKASVAMTSEEENSDLDINDMLDEGMEDTMQFLTELKP